MQAHNNITHLTIRNLMVKAGYPHVPSGLCFGVLFSGIRDFLCHINFDKFNELTTFISQNENLLQLLLIMRRTDSNKATQLINSLFISEEQRTRIYESFALFDLIALFSLSDEYTEIFDQKVTHDKPELIFPHTFANDNNPLAEISCITKWEGVYNSTDLKLLFYSLNECIKNLNNDKLVRPFVITFAGSLNDELHGIGICYDPNTKLWHLIEANQLPIIECNNTYTTENINKVINFIRNAFTKANFNLLRSKVFCLKSNAEYVKELFNQVATFPQFKQIHKVTTEKLSYTDSLGDTLLHYACFNGSKENIVEILKQKPNVNTKNNFGFTPLMIASFQGHAKTAELLLLNNADVNITLKNGVSALFLAAQEGHDEAVQVLCEYNANKKTIFITTADSLLNFAKGTNSLQEMEMLIKQKCSEKNESTNHDADIAISPAEIAYVMKHEGVFNLLTNQCTNNNTNLFTYIK